MKVLFLDDCNMHEGADPIATLVEVKNTNEKQMRDLETKQFGVLRMGGDWVKIMEDGSIEYEFINKGRLSNFNKDDYDISYKLISGNY